MRSSRRARRAGYGGADGNRFDQINVVSDLPGVAPILDPLLVNPWGLALSPTSPLWVANNGTGTATLSAATVAEPRSSRSPSRSP
jgi:hypothetical protein